MATWTSADGNCDRLFVTCPALGEGLGYSPGSVQRRRPMCRQVTVAAVVISSFARGITKEHCAPLSGEGRRSCRRLRVLRREKEYLEAGAISSQLLIRDGRLTVKNHCQVHKNERDGCRAACGFSALTGHVSFQIRLFLCLWKQYIYLLSSVP